MAIIIRNGKDSSGFAAVFSAYGVRNFRLLKNTTRLSIKPFTFLFGPNGCGKSSFIISQDLFGQYLLSEEGRNREMKLNSIYKFGTYSDIAPENDESLPLTFDFELGIKPTWGISKNIDNTLNMGHMLYGNPEKIQVSLTFTKSTKHNDILELNGWEIFDKTSRFHLRISNAFGSNKKAELEITIPEQDEIPIEIRDIYKNAILDQDDFFYILRRLTPYDIQRLSKYWSICLSLTKNNREFLSIMDDVSSDYYTLGDLREDLESLRRDKIAEEVKDIFPELQIDYDMLFDDADNNIFINANTFLLYGSFIIYPYYDFIQRLLNSAFSITAHIKNVRSEITREFQSGDKRNTEDENEIINDLLKLKDFNGLDRLSILVQNLGFGDELVLEKIDPRSSIYQAFIKKGKTRINITDMSSGFKQILPILLKILIYGNYGLIKIEQPELHLHPKLQSDLIRNMASVDQRPNLIIETHSEQMIRTIQVLIAQGIVEKEDVAVYYFDSSDDGTRITQLHLNENGAFLNNWPGGFFDESSDLIFELLRAQIDRRN